MALKDLLPFIGNDDEDDTINKFTKYLCEYQTVGNVTYNVITVNYTGSKQSRTFFANDIAELEHGYQFFAFSSPQKIEPEFKNNWNGEERLCGMALRKMDTVETFIMAENVESIELRTASKEFTYMKRMCKTPKAMEEYIDRHVDTRLKEIATTEEIVNSMIHNAKNDDVTSWVSDFEKDGRFRLVDPLETYTP